MNNQNTPKSETIRQMFGSIASQYDRANSVLSLGVHHLWRSQLVKWSGAREGDSVLDCATGTGDLAIAFKKVVGQSGAVIGTDFCAEMLVPAPEKARNQGMDIQFKQADVTQLPYNDNSFDISSISFGIRNVENRHRGLSELARVTKPGGLVMILEFGSIDWPIIGPAYNFYAEKVLPKIGGWVTGNPTAYEYLQKSSALFPCREEFLRLMESTQAFEDTQYRSLSMGIAFMYKGRKNSII